jgi:hypothetical protein
MARQATSRVHLDEFDHNTRNSLQTADFLPWKATLCLVQTFETVLVDKIENRVAPFDTAAAQQAGDLMALRHRQGRPGELRDR